MGTKGGSRALVAAAMVGGALLLSGCNAPTFGAFRGATSQGQDEFKLWVGMVVTGLVVAGIVWALIFWSVIVYRRKAAGPAIPKQFTEHIPLEIIYTVIPIIIVAVIFYFTVITENEVDAVSTHPAEVVDVTAFQWGWQFHYAGTDVTIITDKEATESTTAEVPSSPLYPQLVLPEGATTEINLTSNDVAHSFWVPAFNFSRMALPGDTNQYFEFTPTQLGVFDGRCNQYCGLYHSEMLFSVKVIPQTAFQSWLSSQESSAAALAAIRPSSSPARSVSSVPALEPAPSGRTTSARRPADRHATTHPRKSSKAGAP